MPNEIPPYLKLHVEEQAEPQRPEPPRLGAHEKLLHTFEALTGWTLADQEVTGDFLDPKRQPFGSYFIDDMSAKLPAGQAALSRVQCGELVEVINEMIQELNQHRSVLRDREAELAAAIPVVPHAEESSNLASRLEAILSGAVHAVTGHAAALYVLDDSTSQLKLRSSWQLPESRYLEPPRQLRGAIADLEALMGHAVVLEDTQLLPHWNAPEDFPSAVCIPVSSSTTPLGTLWIFSDTKRDFSTQETELLEIVAGRIVAELERESILAQGMDAKQADRQLALASSWQVDRLPTIQPLIDDLNISGWTSQSERVGGDFHDWNMLCDGRLALTVGDAQGATIEAGLTAASLNSSIRAHSMYRPEPAELAAGVNESMWTCGMGDQFASVLYGVLNPADWCLNFMLSGSVSAYLIGNDSIEVFDEESPMLGVEPDCHFRQIETTLHEGMSFVVLTEGMRSALWKSGVSESDDGIAEFLQRHILAGAHTLVSLVQQIADKAETENVLFDRAVLALEHRTGGPSIE